MSVQDYQIFTRNIWQVWWQQATRNCMSCSACGIPPVSEHNFYIIAVIESIYCPESHSLRTRGCKTSVQCSGTWLIARNKSCFLSKITFHKSHFCDDTLPPRSRCLSSRFAPTCAPFTTTASACPCTFLLAVPGEIADRVMSTLLEVHWRHSTIRLSPLHVLITVCPLPPSLLGHWLQRYALFLFLLPDPLSVMRTH